MNEITEKGIALIMLIFSLSCKLIKCILTCIKGVLPILNILILGSILIVIWITTNSFPFLFGFAIFTFLLISFARNK